MERLKTVTVGFAKKALSWKKQSFNFHVGIIFTMIASFNGFKLKGMLLNANNATK